MNENTFFCTLYDVLSDVSLLVVSSSLDYNFVRNVIEEVMKMTRRSPVETGEYLIKSEPYLLV